MFKKILINTVLLSVTFLSTILSPMATAGIMEDMIDQDDGWVDASHFILNNPYGFLPVPIIITEPAVGNGLGGAIVFFHETEEEKKERKRIATENKKVFIPPSATIAFGAYTTSDSWVAGGGHIAHWKDDNIRYEGYAGLANVNLDFYGIGDSNVQLNNGVKWSMEGGLIIQRLLFRIQPESSWFAGINFQYSDIQNSFAIGDFNLDDICDPLNLESDCISQNLAVKDLGMGIIIKYESLNHKFSPSTGLDINWGYDIHDKAIGGDFDYHILATENRYYFEANKTLTLGIRLDATFTEGDIPLFAAPFIDISGIPVMRYQGLNVYTSEAQVIYSVHPRWQLNAFVGEGRATDHQTSFSDAASRVAYGAGFRYLFVKALGISTGIDIAKGPEETVTYLKFGTSF